MRVLGYILILILPLISCREENPVPTNFLDYDLPYYQNLDASILKELNEQIELGVFGDIHSLLILRNDKIVFENYYANFTREDLHPINGSTQSIISAIIGTEEYLNENFSLSSRIIDYFPEYNQFFDNIPQKDKIEIRHLLSHTSGFWWDEWMQPFGTDNNDAYVMSQSNDWIANVLSTPMIKEPGNNFNFNSGNAVLLAPILEKETGNELEELVKNRLFDPLEIYDWKWELTPNDYANTAWGLQMKPVDMAKIGYLFLNNGIWKDQVLFEESWINRSTRVRNWASSYLGHGYYWWRFSGYSNTVQYLTQNDIYFSWGSGGQFIFVIPHLDMVIVTTAGNYNNNDTIALDMLRDYIFKAVKDRYI